MKIRMKMLTDATSLLAVTLVLTMALLPTAFSAAEEPASQIEEDAASSDGSEEQPSMASVKVMSGASAASLNVAVQAAKEAEAAAKNEENTIFAQESKSEQDDPEESEGSQADPEGSTAQTSASRSSTPQSTKPPETTPTRTEGNAGSVWSEETAGGTMYVNTDGIYSREVAAVGSARVRQYALNEAVTVVALTDTNYYKLEDGSFIHADYLSSTQLDVTTVPETEPEPDTDTDTESDSETEPEPEPETQSQEIEVAEDEPVPLSAQPEAQSMALEMFRLVNEYRAGYGLQPLQWDYNAYPAAQIRAGELLQNNSHTRPNGTRFSTVYNDIGYSPSASGENIVYYYQTAASAFHSLVNSASHRALILSTNYTHVAIAYTYDAGSYWGYYWVQEFTRP